MAETWLAVQHGEAGFEQRVCLKLVHEHLRDTDDFMKLFLREAAIAASLRHSNIVGVIDASPSEGCMALELVDGTDLRMVLDHAPKRRLSPQLVIYIAIELAKALHYAHGRTRGGQFAGIVHRDVSPANILASYAGEIKLADFGIAKAIRATGDVGSGVRGKLSYVSPEQLQGGRIDARSDIFSLGVVLFEALTGQTPFDADNELETWKRITRGERPALSSLAPQVPRQLRTVIETALAVEPARRFSSAASIVHELAALTPPPTVYRELGSLVRHAIPHQTLSGTADELAIAGLSSAAPVRGSQLATQTMRRPANVGTQALTPRPWRTDTRSRSPHWARRAAVATAAIAALVPTTLWGYRQAFPRVERLPQVTAPQEAIAGVPAAAAPSSPAVTLRSTPPSGPSAAAPRPDAETAVRPMAVLQNPATAPQASTPPSAAAAAEQAQRGARPTRSRPARPRRPEPSRREPSRREPPAPSGRVLVGVFPSGMVWADGQLRGRAPLTLQLPVGKHRVAAGQDTPVQTQEVEIGEGPAEPIFFHLRDASQRASER